MTRPGIEPWPRGKPAAGSLSYATTLGPPEANMLCYSLQKHVRFAFIHRGHLAFFRFQMVMMYLGTDLTSNLCKTVLNFPFVIGHP
jgi:hypothetical protein